MNISIDSSATLRKKLNKAIKTLNRTSKYFSFIEELRKELDKRNEKFLFKKIFEKTNDESFSVKLSKEIVNGDYYNSSDLFFENWITYNNQEIFIFSVF